MAKEIDPPPRDKQTCRRTGQKGLHNNSTRTKHAGRGGPDGSAAVLGAERNGEEVGGCHLPLQTNRKEAAAECMMVRSDTIIPSTSCVVTTLATSV